MNPDLGNPVIFTVLNIFVWLDDEVLCSPGNVYISKIFIEPSALRFRLKLESPYSNILTKVIVDRQNHVSACIVPE